MDWIHETYRRLYVRTNAQWLMLPVSARGLGSELLKYCDDDGRIPLGGDLPGEAIARLVSARRNEWERIDADIAALIGDGYLVIDGDVLVVRNFVEAQDKSKAAKRTEAWRARKASPKPSHGDAPKASRLPSPVTVSVTPATVTPAVTGDGGGDDPVTSPPSVPSVPPKEEKSAGATDVPETDELPKSTRDEIVELLEGSDEIREAVDSGTLDFGKMVGGLLSDAMAGGWKDSRVVACLPSTLRALSMAGDPSKGPQAFVRNMICRIARPGVLEAEQAKFTRAPKPLRDRDDDMPRRPEWGT